MKKVRKGKRSFERSECRRSRVRYSDEAKKRWPLHWLRQFEARIYGSIFGNAKEAKKILCKKKKEMLRLKNEGKKTWQLSEILRLRMSERRFAYHLRAGDHGGRSEMPTSPKGARKLWKIEPRPNIQRLKWQAPKICWTKDEKWRKTANSLSPGLGRVRVELVVWLTSWGKKKPPVWTNFRLALSLRALSDSPHMHK